MEMSMRNVIIAISVKHNFDWEETYKAIKEKEELVDEDFEKAKEFVDSVKGKAITILDEDYPQEIKNWFKPPLLLICCGKKGE